MIQQFICLAQPTKKRVLIFSKTNGYYHESIPAGIDAIQELGKAHDFMVDTTTNGSLFTDDGLSRYAAIIFLSPSGNVLDSVQKACFIRYIQAGGGFMGIHGASTIERDWKWYGQLVGAVFSDHPEPQYGTIIISDHNDPSTRHLPSKWIRKDEWYNFREIPVNVHVLLVVDEGTYEGGTHGEYHPLAWCHEFDGGRSFYTAIGHYADSYKDPLQMAHILAGIQYAMGDNVVKEYANKESATDEN